MSTNNSIAELTSREYKAGFITDIESESIPPGLSEDIIRTISAHKRSPSSSSSGGSRPSGTGSP